MSVLGKIARSRLGLVVLLLVAFLAVDRFLVRARADSFDRSRTKVRELKEELYRVRSERERAEALEGLLGGAEAESQPVVAISYLNRLMKEHRLRKVELGADSRVESHRGEPYRLTVRGGYSQFVRFLCDLESSPTPIWIRDFRIAEVLDETKLEMRVRLEIEGETP